MDITLTTPALLFPAISLLLVAYTNRFNALSARIRSLHSSYRESPSELLVAQLNNLQGRIYLIRNMQGLGVASLFLCVLCMFALFADYPSLGKILFGISMLLMLASLGYSLREIVISLNALKLELSQLQLNKDD